MGIIDQFIRWLGYRDPVVTDWTTDGGYCLPLMLKQAGVLPEKRGKDEEDEEKESARR